MTGHSMSTAPPNAAAAEKKQPPVPWGGWDRRPGPFARASSPARLVAAPLWTRKDFHGGSDVRPHPECGGASGKCLKDVSAQEAERVSRAAAHSHLEVEV